EFARALGRQLLRVSDEAPPQLELVYGSWDPPGARLLDVVEVMDRLRSPGGCPWDAEQTHASLLPYLLEEAYEAYDAVRSGNRDDIVEEFGDVLLQAVFHARLAEDAPEGQSWNIDDVAAGLVNKLVSRHPHVFGDVSVSSADEVLTNWEQIKRSEKGRSSALDGVARSQPALSLARKYVGKVAKFGLDVPAPVLPSGVTVPTDSEQLGELLLAIVAEARKLDLDAEAALRDAADRYAGHVRAAEAAAGPVAEQPSAEPGANQPATT
ncbi:MAG: MazG family protein, partial [Pseudonocardiaceae bacterium]